jgi:hypothetical protein
MPARKKVKKEKKLKKDKEGQESRTEGRDEGWQRREVKLISP